MKLLYSLTSPYARKVRIVAAEKRIDLDMELVVLASPDNPVSQHNPLGKIPVLVMEDGESIYDSRVIVEFLDHRTPVAHLIPQDHSLKIKVRRWEALADGVCDAAVIAVMEGRRPDDRQDAGVIEKQLGKVTRGLKAMSEGLGDAKWCVNESLSLADIAVGCVLGYLELRCADIDWKSQYPNLAKLYQELMKRPSFKNTLPPA